MKRSGAVAVAAVAFSIALGGCSRNPDDRTSSSSGSLPGAVGSDASHLLRAPGAEMPGWLDLYKSKSIVNVATVDHVVIVKFETLGQRDEVFRHYAGEFGDEENFVSFRDSRDIISFLREGYGVKITLLDSSKNLWSLEYHKQAI